MAMTKKRISGILLAVALFVGVFAATPAFAATTTTAKGVTIDWAAETIQFNDANLTATIDGDTFYNNVDPQDISGYIPDFGSADAKLVIHDQRDDSLADPTVNDVTVVIPARPAAPTYLSPVNPQFTIGTTSIKVNSPVPSYEYKIYCYTDDSGTDFAATSEFNNLKPAYHYHVYARVAAVAGKNFASDEFGSDCLYTEDFTSYFVDGEELTIAIKDGFGLYTDAAMKNQIALNESTTPIDDYLGKSLYVKNEAKGSYEIVDLTVPAAPAAPKFIAGATTIKFDGDKDALAAFQKGYEVAEIAANTADALKTADYDMWIDMDGLTADTPHYFAVRAIGTTTSLPSAPVVVTVTTLRSAPTSPIFKYDFANEKVYFGSDVTPLEANTKADFTGSAIKTGDSIAAVIDAAKDADRVIYFRLPATAAKAASDSFGIYVGSRPEGTPSAPVVTSTEETITITNKYASNVEFSIDGSNWTTKTVFTAKDNKVEDGKDYTVYARFMGTDAAWPSVAAKTAVKTPAKKVVTFKSGATVVATSKFVNGAALVYPAAPKKTGYRFAGWDVAAGTAVTADMTVNAQWKVIRGLKTIRKSAGRMTPAFKISQKTYKVVLSKSTSSVKLVAKRRSTAQVVKTYYKGKVYKSYYKTVKLARGASTTVKFYVKAADGKTTTYYVKVVRK